MLFQHNSVHHANYHNINARSSFWSGAIGIYYRVRTFGLEANIFWEHKPYILAWQPLVVVLCDIIQTQGGRWVSYPSHRQDSVVCFFSPPLTTTIQNNTRLSRIAYSIESICIFPIQCTVLNLYYSELPIRWIRGTCLWRARQALQAQSHYQYLPK